MHAVVARASIENRESAERTLKEQIVPMVSELPGFVAGYWTNVGGDQGRSMVVFESEDAAEGVVQRLRDAPPEFVTFDSIEVAEVVAHA